MPVCGVSQAFTDKHQVSLVEAQEGCPTYIEFLCPREGALDSEVQCMYHFSLERLTTNLNSFNSGSTCLKQKTYCLLSLTDIYVIGLALIMLWA